MLFILPKGSYIPKKLNEHSTRTRFYGDLSKNDERILWKPAVFREKTRGKYDFQSFKKIIDEIIHYGPKQVR